MTTSKPCHLRQTASGHLRLASRNLCEASKIRCLPESKQDSLNPEHLFTCAERTSRGATGTAEVLQFPSARSRSPTRVPGCRRCVRSAGVQGIPSRDAWQFSLALRPAFLTVLRNPHVAPAPTNSLNTPHLVLQWKVCATTVNEIDTSAQAAFPPERLWPLPDAPK